MHVVTHGDWASKQSDMERWYRDLLLDPGLAHDLFADDYAPHAAFLAQLRGHVLDVGGGAGPTGRYLRPGCRYVVVDPSTLWNSREWESFGRDFRGAEVAVEYLPGTGEDLPLANGSFDAVVSMWALNHARDPYQCIREMARVAKPGAVVLTVLEDMEPNWADAARVVGQKLKMRLGVPTEPTSFHNAKVQGGIKGLIARKLRGRPWPVQDDHILIDEARLLRAARTGLRLIRREWLGGFLTLEFRKTHQA